MINVSFSIPLRTREGQRPLMFVTPFGLQVYIPEPTSACNRPRVPGIF
jgi:hypothetical protein